MAVADEGLNGGGKGDVPEGLAFGEIAHGLAEGGGGRGGDLARVLGHKAARFLQGENGQQRKEDTRDARHQKGGAPAIGISHQPAHDQAHEPADRRAHGIEGERRGALFLGHIVGDQGVGRRRAARLTDTHADAEENQLPEVGGDGAKGSEPAPDRHGRANDDGAIAALGEARDGDTEHRVEQRKGQSAHQAQLPVGEA